MAKIKQGDVVEVLTGTDKGKTGKVLKVNPKENWVQVEGVKVQSRRVKPGSRAGMPDGGTQEKHGKVHISNVRPFFEKAGRGVRVGFQLKDDGSKVRVVRGREHTGAEL